jgi:uncharacterized membrane protein (UPF0127 family)
MDPMKQTDRGRLRRALVGAGIVVSVVFAMIWMSIEKQGLPTMPIETPGGVILGEVADTPAARSAGLSNRDAISGIDALLLKWQGPGRHPIWMAGIRFSLDLVWIDADGHAIAVLPNVPPCHTDPCPLYEPDGSERSVAVLEMPAGAAARHGIAAGATVRLSVNSRR